MKKQIPHRCIFSIKIVPKTMKCDRIFFSHQHTDISYHIWQTQSPIKSIYLIYIQSNFSLFYSFNQSQSSYQKFGAFNIEWEKKIISLRNVFENVSFHYLALRWWLDSRWFECACWRHFSAQLCEISKCIKNSHFQPDVKYMGVYLRCQCTKCSNGLPTSQHLITSNLEKFPF